MEAPTVKIGNQIWMTENLDVNTFRNGEEIPEARTNSQWMKAGEEQMPVWCYYNNDPLNGKKYGRLYNWHAVNDPRGLAPTGWHIPTLFDFQATINSSREASITISQLIGKVQSGIPALLAGFRYKGGDFGGLYFNTYMWGATENYMNTADYLYLDYISKNVYVGTDYKTNGFSARCIKDSCLLI